MWLKNLKNLWWKNLYNTLYSIISWLFTSCGIWFLIYQIWTYPNLYAIDFGWQIASAELFIQYGLHGWSLQRFQWIINNLFYPPLQDSIVALIHWVTWLETLFSFLIYCSILLVWYFWVTRLISSKFKYIGSKILYLIWVFMFFMINKFPNVWFIQGLWVVDILFTWLISQILWGLFLQLTIYEMLGKKRIGVLSLYSVLWLLSHLVVWPVIILLTTIFIIAYKRKFIFQYIWFLLGATAFFWLPFLWYKWLMSSTTNIDSVPHIIILISILWAYIGRKHSSILAVGITSILILLPSEIYTVGKLFNITIQLPHFHYYRFISSACLLSLVIIWFISDTLFWYLYNKHKKINSTLLYIAYTLVNITIMVWLYNTRWGFWSPMQKALWKPEKPTQESLQLLSWLDANYKIFTIDKTRPIDFSLDALDQYLWHKNLYFKWLFWESSYTNQLISSYIANILSPTNSVLYRYNLWNMPYYTYQRIWNKFVENYWIWYLIVAPIEQITYLSNMKHEYLWKILQSWTTEFSTQKLWLLPINNTNYTLYKIIPTPNSILQNTLVSIVTTPPHKIVFDPKEKVFSKTMMNTYYQTKQDTAYQPDIIYSAWDQNINFTYNSWTANITQINASTYKITTTSIGPTWLQIKIGPLPWISFYDEDNKHIESIDLPYSRYIFTDWGKPVYMTYKKPYIFYISYTISILTLIYMIYWYTSKRLKSKNKRD